MHSIRAPYYASMISMTVNTKYKHSPITEALIDFRTSQTTHDPDVDVLKFLAQANRGLEKDYPIREELYFFEGVISTAPSPTVRATNSHIGYKFTNTDRKYVFQPAVESFTVNRLAPYEAWESFRDEAKKLWNSYLELARVTTVTRIAVRYINKIDLPLSFNDFRDYLSTLPEISSAMPNALSGYFMQLQIPLPTHEARIILTQALIEPSKKDVATVLLDIDVSKENLLIELASSEGNEWKILDELHEEAGVIFEACITDKTRRLFD